jgi:hypothetical protein
MTDMHIATWLLFLAGPVGAIDVIYFHLWKFRLYSRPQSRAEELTHIIRGVMVPAVFAVLLIGRPEGTLYWIVAALFFLDTLNSLLDVMIEPRSRAPIGVPPQELAIHFIGTTMMGASWATYMIAGWATRSAPSALIRWPPGTFPPWLPSLAWGALAFGVVLVLVETMLVVRYARVAVTR